MSLFLLLPVGLAALAALLLPVLLHLARRSEPRRVPFAALRWLRAQPQPRRRHRLEEWLLLALRLLLLLALALLLAQPMLSGRPDRTPRVALADGVSLAAARAALGDADGAATARWLRLAPGFPPLDPHDDDRGTAARNDLPLASLLRELDAQLPAATPLTVVVPAVLDGADAQRPVLSRQVRWRVAAGAMPSPDTAAPARTAPPVLEVRTAGDEPPALRYLRAAGTAWTVAAGRDPDRTDPVRVAAPAAPLPATATPLAWLVPGPVPAAVRDWVAGGGTLLLDAGTRWDGFPDDAVVAWQDADGAALAREARHGRGRVLRLQRAWTPAAMPLLLDPGFPRQLQALLAPPPAAPARVDATGYVPVRGLPAWPERPRPLAPWLAWLVAALFLLERWVAAGPRRGSTA